MHGNLPSNLTEKQEEMLKNIQVVISLPIVLAVRAPFRVKHEKKAVINLESENKKSLNSVTVEALKFYDERIPLAEK